ncbi:MAG TPA: hypothetical protein VFV71_13765 [Burkholderiales bacterium]|nr:hypothetical protein [Burkholderiales bacterium]
MDGRFLVLAVLAALSACGEDKAPQTDAAADSHPVKNVEALPSGTIREGAKTMNSAADLGRQLEQQKQDREKKAEER